MTSPDYRRWVFVQREGFWRRHFEYKPLGSAFHRIVVAKVGQNHGGRGGSEFWWKVANYGDADAIRSGNADTEAHAKAAAEQAAQSYIFRNNPDGKRRPMAGEFAEYAGGWRRIERVLGKSRDGWRVRLEAADGDVVVTWKHVRGERRPRGRGWFQR